MNVYTIIHYILKTVAYALCALGCFYQVVSILNIYFSFPTTVFSFVEIMETLKLPAISICNNNRIMLSKLREFDNSFNETWVQLEQRYNQKKNVNRIKLVMQQLIDRTVRNLMETLNVSEFAQLGNEWDDFIEPDYFRCATDPFNLDNKCIKYANIIQSAQEVGNCFTVFRHSENNFLENIAIKSGLSQSPVIRGVGEALNLETADKPFNPNEIFRMMVNFSIEEYTTLNEKIMGYIIIHDHNELPPINEKNFFIYPGYYYELYISKQTGKYLEKPYVTDCINYNIKATDTSQQGFIPQVLSRETCIMNCMSKKTVEICNCWPPELPYVLSNTSDGLKWCSWRDGINIVSNVNKSDNLSWFKFCFANNENECNKQCKLQCLVDKYFVIRQSFIWPSNERIEHSKKYNKEYRKCCALISIRFWSSESTIRKYEPKYAFVEFISYFGGLLSMWLGFSFVKTYDVFEIVIKKIIQKYLSNGWNIFGKKSNRIKAKRPKVAKHFKTIDVTTNS